MERFPLAKAVMNETLRLYSPADGQLRQAVQPVTLTINNVQQHIPKGTVIHLYHLGRQLSKDVFGEDAHQFFPQRFLENPDLIKIIAPFGMGPRTCIGKRFSEMEIILIMLKVVGKFTFSSRCKLERRMTVSIGSTPDLLLSLLPRK